MTNNTHRINTSESVLKQLRSLMPSRVLSYHEALQRAELQAGRLLELHGISGGPVPIEIVTEAPRIRLAYDWDLPASGSAVWDGEDWVISLQPGENRQRQRFSLVHEYKHIIDHPTRHLIRGDHSLSADVMAERVADFFAACVLMPKAWIKAAYFGGTQSVQALASRFQVSPHAMSVRLSQLGLTDRTRRCERPITPIFVRPRGTASYFRQLAIPTGVSS